MFLGIAYPPAATEPFCTRNIVTLNPPERVFERVESHYKFLGFQVETIFRNIVVMGMRFSILNALRKSPSERQTSFSSGFAELLKALLNTCAVLSFDAVAVEYE
jgi:hypothetical protein